MDDGQWLCPCDPDSCFTPAKITLTIEDQTPDGPITHYKRTTYRDGRVVDETPPSMADILGE